MGLYLRSLLRLLRQHPPENFVELSVIGLHPHSFAQTRLILEN